MDNDGAGQVAAQKIKKQLADFTQIKVIFFEDIKKTSYWRLKYELKKFSKKI